MSTQIKRLAAVAVIMTSLSDMFKSRTPEGYLDAMHRGDSDAQIDTLQYSECPYYFITPEGTRVAHDFTDTDGYNPTLYAPLYFGINEKGELRNDIDHELAMKTLAIHTSCFLAGDIMRMGSDGRKITVTVESAHMYAKAFEVDLLDAISRTTLFAAASGSYVAKSMDSGEPAHTYKNSLHSLKDTAMQMARMSVLFERASKMCRESAETLQRIEASITKG